uniref:Uncharacterized protein n=1 Tax=Salarias fasciatus TaxID=181472 RepID=A0A672G2S4_SALFA
DRQTQCKFISFSNLNSLCPLPAATQVPGTRPSRPVKPRGFPLDAATRPPDAYYDDETVTPIVPKAASPEARTDQHCAFSPCAENQTPCSELAASTGCLCPGFTLHNAAPLTPDLRSVQWNGSEVVLRWCAPYSHISSYVATVGGRQRRTFEEGRRSGSLGRVDHISQVCLFAVNDGGESDASCKMFYPRDRSLPLTAGLVGGALGLLLLVLLAVLLWRHRKQRKQEASISAHNAAESL